MCFLFAVLLGNPISLLGLHFPLAGYVQLSSFLALANVCSISPSVTSCIAHIFAVIHCLSCASRGERNSNSKREVAFSVIICTRLESNQPTAKLNLFYVFD